jgi:hypothetical protein
VGGGRRLSADSGPSSSSEKGRRRRIDEPPRQAIASQTTILGCRNKINSPTRGTRAYRFSRRTQIYLKSAIRALKRR